MRFEHGSHRTECLRAAAAALLIVRLLLCCCCLCCRLAESTSSNNPLLLSTVTESQCLPLDEALDYACRGTHHHVRLRFCSAYEPVRLLKGACDRPGLDRLMRLDAEASRVADQFARIVDRYDCENANSKPWTCKDCVEAYKQWVCAMFLPPVQVEGEVESLKPCRYVCRLVEQRCPYFHPSVKEQYAGERVFKCIDPDIPDLDSIQGDSSYGPAHRCYCPQHLDAAGADQGKKEGAEPECQLLSPAQLRRNASRWGHQHHRSRASTVLPSTVLLAALAVAWWTMRTR